MKLLPKWNITDKFPALFDYESATAIEQTAKLYGAMNELIEEYNSFVDSVNTKIEEFVSSTNGDYETFKIALRQEFQDFIDVVELKLKSQDKEIDDAILYMKNNLQISINTLLKEIRDNGELYEDIQIVFDEVKNRVSQVEHDLGNTIYSPVSFPHMFGWCDGWTNNLGNNAFVGHAVILSKAFNFEATATKNSYQIITGKRYYWYFVLNTNDAFASEENPSKLKLEILSPTLETVYHTFEFDVVKKGVSTYNWNFVFDGGEQDYSSNPHAYVYKIRLSYICEESETHSPTALLSNLRCSPDVQSSGQTQPLLPIIKKQVPTYSPRYEIIEGSTFRYYNGVFSINAKFKCIQPSVALVQFPTFREAFSTDLLNQYTYVKYYNVTKNKEGYVYMVTVENYPWLYFKESDVTEIEIDDEIVICTCIPWFTQPDMMLYDIEM